MGYLAMRNTQQQLAFNIATGKEALARYGAKMSARHKYNLRVLITENEAELYTSLLDEYGEFKWHAGDYWNPPEVECVSTGRTCEAMQDMIEEAPEEYEEYEGEFEEKVRDEAYYGNVAV